MYKLLITPPNPKLPTELIVSRVPEDADFIGRLLSCQETEQLFPIGDRELQLLIEFRDVIPLQIRALIGLPGTDYDAVWSTYAASLDRITLDNLEYELRVEANKRSDEGQNVQSTTESRNALVRPKVITDEDADEEELTGEIG